jgi:hypothetical protein
MKMIRVPDGEIEVGGVKKPVKGLYFQETEMPWEIFEIWALRMDQTAEQQATGVDAVSRPSKPYAVIFTGFGHHGYPANCMSHAAMLIQIPYSLDEVLATLQFLGRRRRAGRNVLRILVFGDTDEGQPPPRPADEFDRPLPVLAREMVGGGVALPWNLALCAAIGAWLMLSRLVLGSEEAAANFHHVIGSLVQTTTANVAAEVARSVRVSNCLEHRALNRGHSQRP